MLAPVVITALWIIGGLVACVIAFILNPIQGMMNSAIIAAFLVALYGWIGVVGGSGYQSEGTVLSLAIFGTIAWIALLIGKSKMVSQ